MIQRCNFDKHTHLGLPAGWAWLHRFTSGSPDRPCRTRPPQPPLPLRFLQGFHCSGKPGPQTAALCSAEVPKARGPGFAWPGGLHGAPQIKDSLRYRERNETLQLLRPTQRQAPRAASLVTHTHTHAHTRTHTHTHTRTHAPMRPCASAHTELYRVCSSEEAALTVADCAAPAPPHSV
jgi:hypothetical protein